MSIHVALRHVTRYEYDRQVTLSPQVVRLRPAPHCRTRILSYSLSVQPQKHFINWQQDPQGNYLARLVFPEKTGAFSVEVDLVAEMAVHNPFDFFLEPQAESLPFAYDPQLAHELEPYHRRLPLTPRLGDYLREARQQLHKTGETARTIDFLVGLNQRLWNDIRYTIRMEPGVQTPEETLKRGSGSCRDSSWLLVQLLRHLGLAARFVSGYLIQLKADLKSLDGPSGTEVDFTDLHAWCEVYLPGAGWLGLDPTSGLLAGEGHIPLAATPDPQSAAPVSGLVEPSECVFSHEMKVTRIHESPRVTRPYTPEQWQAIDRLGHQIDEDLSAGDVRLTMGGEPTFVSIDDMEGDEWNTAALGPTKRQLSGQLIRRLKTAFAPGALLHFGQGKWYPGESLPRWALGCYWRKDGVPIWNDETLFANEDVDYGHAEVDARRFGLAMAAALGVAPQWLIPGYEDGYYYLWREKRLPVNVDPIESNLKDAEERGRLARLFEQGLDKIVGYALPLARQEEDAQPRWRSGPWFFRDDTLYLIPGDSPMGFRLPLESLPWVDPKEYPYIHEPDPTAPVAALPPAPKSRQHFLNAVAGMLGPLQGTQHPQSLPDPANPLERLPGDHESAPWLARTAMCFEARQGRMHVFMPPVADTEDYLDLISAIEATASALSLPVVIEGAAPPHDPRLEVLKVTPDPGVIEVNMHPAKTWEQLVASTKVLYEEARQTRLGTEKFMLDGRHTGTGGGNHIVVGGGSPADSPILRRPDLLKSLLGYWHNHPALSYLFSGLFIGPTSQSPRIDEARNDSVFELELAFKELDRLTEGAKSVPPWLVDRIFRNLLADATGNTHRTEFSIDKLYDPASATGRLGLVELRSFEMPPHAEMSLAQHLLLRAAIARFWKQPYQNKLVRWGTELHDRFLLPHFIWEDFTDVMDDMTRAGYPMQPDWFAPHFEFKFPTVGGAAHRGVQLELRAALEPWHVLGEEGAIGGTVRYVDSSLERLQVKVNGLIGGRHLVTCNGSRVPLHPTGVAGEYVAAVRYRAWQPPNCLQPTIGVHSPLVFDLFDTWNDRSLGGCSYHVVHPGGRNYVTFPVNAYEAESRRLARFFPNTHTPGSMEPLLAKIIPEFPLTLDLRQGG